MHPDPEAPHYAPVAGPSREKLWLAEILGALSLVTDLARGRPPEEAVRACGLATRLAGSMGLEGDELSHV